MMEVITDLPNGVVGMKAHGKLTHADYEKELSPMLESAVDAFDKVSFLYVIESFDGAEAEALWDDAVLGIRHWNDFERIGVVTDIDWIKQATNMFGWMIPADVKIFPLSDIEDAKKWVSAGVKSKAA